MKAYKFWTKTKEEGVKEHNIKAESCKKAYEMLKSSGYLSGEITMTAYKRS